MVKCENCQVVGTGPRWHNNQYGVPIWDEHETPKCATCGNELKPVSAPGADACVAQLGYRREGWIAA
jgi:hypothetical protein